MKYYATLTDLLNNDTAAYNYFYELSPQTQALLQQRDIRCIDELRQAAVDVDMEQRPKAF